MTYVPYSYMPALYTGGGWVEAYVYYGLYTSGGDGGGEW